MNEFGEAAFPFEPAHRIPLSIHDKQATEVAIHRCGLEISYLNTQRLISQPAKTIDTLHQ